MRSSMPDSHEYAIMGDNKRLQYLIKMNPSVVNEKGGKVSIDVKDFN